jgi:hypothetical protein
MIANFAVAAFMVALTVTVHFFGLLGLVWFLREHGHRFRPHEKWAGQGISILFVVLGLMAIHTVEIWLYAHAFLAIGALADFEVALYFFDRQLHHDRLWRRCARPPVAAARRHRGRQRLLLFGWSTPSCSR